ncbi:hypothetical protein FACS1894180_6340 [Bacteroidia bacterium]|nr:hypothetical protein FACS1894180_6340 [Bacteroidia bacterium]
MMYINPIELLELQNYSAQEIDSSLIKKQKRKIFADIDLSDDGLFDYKGISLTKTDCERAIDDLENTDYVEFYLYLANNNQPLNDFLVNGDVNFFTKISQESIYKLPEFVHFISPYFAPRFDKALLKVFTEFETNIEDIVKTRRLLQTQNLIQSTDINTAFKNLSIEITSRINQIAEITKKIKNETTDYTDDDIDEVESLVRNLFPVAFLNKLPPYFQSQINKIAAAINQLQLAIWDNLHNSSVCKQLLEHLLALNIESVSKQTFEKNYEIVKKADEKEKIQDKLQNQIDKLIALVNSFESKSKTIVNARELIYQAKPYLFNIKAISQGNDNIYISLSTRVAATAQDFVVEDVNKQQSSDNKFDSILGFPKLKSVLKNAWETIQLIGSLDLQEDFRTNRYNPNKETLQDICKKLDVTTPQSVTGKMPQCNFVILDSEITHTNNGNLPITNPFIRGDIRYIGLNLKVEALGNQSVKFSLKYIQPNGTIKTGTSSPAGFSFAEDKIINVNTKLISLSGWGNAEKSTYVVGTHHIEVWIDGCMIYKKSFVVDFSPEEKQENAKREAERRERERIEAERRKEQAKIEKQKAKEKKRKLELFAFG